MNFKKLEKIIFALIISITSFFAATSEVMALEVPNTINLSSSSAIKGYIGDNVNFGTKTLADGTLAYCLDYHKQTTVNTTATLVGEMDAGMAYLLENGYPNKSITGNKEKDYYITQTAIWWYLDTTTSSKNLDEAFKTTDSDPYNLRNYIKKLVAEAIAAKNKGYKNPQISASTTDNYLSISSDKKYYISNEIQVSTTDLDNYTVSLTSAPEGSYITDISGNKKYTFKAGETFKVYVPVTKTTTKKTEVQVSLTASTTFNKVYEYAPQSSEEQNIVPVILYPTTVDVSTSLSLSVASSKVTIIKTDASTKRPLSGATLVVKDKDGNEVARFTTTTEAYTLYDLSNGTYTISEIKAPEGYALSDKTYTFTIDNDNRDESITVENYPEVFVPDTNSNSSIIMYILGGIIIISGIGFAIYNAKKQKQN